LRNLQLRGIALEHEEFPARAEHHEAPPHTYRMAGRAGDVFEYGAKCDPARAGEPSRGISREQRKIAPEAIKKPA
jgi:hypothetical protein